MAIAAWATVITGTWIVYPWYRVSPMLATLAAEDAEDDRTPGRPTSRL